jgi:hypothetical protein
LIIASIWLYLLFSDPLNSQNNLGRSCFGFRQLQQEFDNALERVMACCAQDLSFNDTSSGNRRRSVLGAVFGTEHHDSVVRLQSQVWCPQEHFASSSNGSINSSSSQPIADAPERDDEAIAACVVEAEDREEKKSAALLLQEECERLLGGMSEQQLIDARDALLAISNSQQMKK